MRIATGHSLGRAFGGTFLVYLAGMLLLFAVQILLTRLLGVAEYGRYSLVLAWVAALLIGARGGLDQMLLRFVPTYAARGQWALFKGVMRWSAGRAALLSLPVAVGLSAGASLVSGLPAGLVQTFYLGSLVLPVMVYVCLRAALLRSLGHVALALLPEAVIAPLVLGVVMAALWLLPGGPLTSGHAMAATLAGLAASALLGSRMLSARLPAELRGRPAGLEPAVWRTSARSMLLIAGAHGLLGNIDSIMLGMLKGAPEVGVYAVAAKCALLVSAPLTIANATIAPLISRFHATGEGPRLQEALARSMKLVSLAALAAFALLGAAGARLLAVFGEEFVIGHAALVILALGGLSNALAGPAANLLSLTGSERYVSMVLLAATALNIFLNLALVPSWGVEGAAVATATSMLAWNGLLFVAAGRRLGISPNPLLKRS